MMLQTGSWHCFPFLFLLFMLHLGPILAYLLKDCTILYSDNTTDGVSVDCASSDLVSVPDNLPRDVILLRLTGNIQKIHRTDFHHLSNLTYLDMSFNSITHVDDGAFVPLVQLKMLCMHNNKLTTLTDNMFQGLSNLLILSLDYNNITSINPAAFQSLPSLQELSLTPNHITDIITILQLPYLQVLSISTNELESFQTKDLPLNISSNLKELKVMSQSVKMFSITTVFPHLKTIDLSKCCNDKWEWDIPDKCFLRNITTVHLTGSSFNPIRKALESLGSLEYLQLRLEGVWINRDLLKIICKIPTLRTLILLGGINANLSKRLSHCTQLTNLDLSHNNLTELSKNSIKHMNQLSHLNLAHNNLSTVPHDVKKLFTLRTLNLSNNNIHELNCSDFKHLTRLTHLHLDYNRVTKLEPCVFKHLNGLKVLTLIHNFIRRFGNTFKIGLHNLELLDLNENIIYKLSKGEFNGLKLLKNLHVMVFCIRNPWENNFLEGLDELETLSLHFNKIYFKMTPSPPYKLEWQTKSTLLRRLKSFTLEVGPLYRDPNIWDMLSNMKLLEHLNMYGLLLDPNNTFKHVPQLKTLSLINCNLTSLDFLAQANLTKISWLDLSQNELTVINVSVFSFLPALRYLKIDKNPLACDCSNADFQQWMQNNNQTLVVDAQRYTCGFPLTKKGTRFLDFDYHSCWVDASFICFISSTCVIVLTLLTSFTYHFLRLHLLYAYYLFLAFLYDAKERKRGSPQCYDAFISYNVHDELWVCREMLPVLEGEQGWRLCLHHRDFLPGKPIIENITDAIYGSRKTICVISHHYLESEWCSREIQMASFRLFDEQKDVLILVFLEDIPAHQLSPYYHMRRLVKSHTYLSWSQAGQHPGLFWQNLRRALDTPHTDLGLNE